MTEVGDMVPDLWVLATFATEVYTHLGVRATPKMVR